MAGAAVSVGEQQAQQPARPTGFDWMYVGAEPDSWQARHVLQDAAASTSSRMVDALASSVFSASASSPTRICRALASIRFSPADRPRSWSRRHRSRTTSATLFTSPEASFSRLALYRRDQFVGSSVCGARSTWNTLSRPSCPTTSRTPTYSALSAGPPTGGAPRGPLKRGDFI